MIIHKKQILLDISGAPRIVLLEVEAPAIARRVLPGQFVVLIPTENGERIPLTVVDTNIDTGTITLILQEAGYSTRQLGNLKEHDRLFSLAGPLGVPTDIKHLGNIIIVGGGVGIAEIYPVIRGFKTAGNYITAILGARSQKTLILKEEIEKFSDDFHVSTDDGSLGEKGFVSDILTRLLQENQGKGFYRLVYAVGPIPMMKKVSEITKEYRIRTMVSLNTLMVDATGMCGCCRVTVGGRTQFACIDGPEFDAHLIDWNELRLRSTMYDEKEKHICNLHKK